MNQKTKYITGIVLSVLVICALTIPAFALTESDVQSQVSASGKEGVAGNLFVWFLCAVAFLKISQKIDSFMQGLGINVGHTGGSMLAEAMLAARSIAAARGVAGRGRGGNAGRAGSTGGGDSNTFLQGGLAGVANRSFYNGAYRNATGTGSGGVGGMAFRASMTKGGDIANNVKRNALTTGVASCYPFTSYELSDENGILFGLNKYNNSPVIIDIFNSKVYKNANIAVCGTSGAGKTFLILLMALRMRRKGIQVFMLAPLKGHEFHRACVNTGGEFISISPASKSCINVLEIRKIDKSVEETLDGPGIERSELAAKIQRLHIFFALLIPDMSYEEKQLLDDALIRTYARKGITHDNTSLSDPDNPNVYRQMPVLGDLYDVLREESDTKRLSNIINRFVHGSASTFNQQTNVNLDNKFTVLDISELSGDLLPIGMFVALDFVWDKAKANRTEEKAIFIDECWQLIGGGSGTFGVGNRLAAEMVLEIFKTIRAYSGSGICATQDLNDFFSLDNGKYGKGIINNCRTKVILNLEDEEAQRVQQVLHLSEAEVMEITHFERGNGLISSNNNNITVEIKASPLERDLITTDRRELLDLLRRMKRPEA